MSQAAQRSSNNYRIVERVNGFEPQMRYTTGATGNEFWTPLLLNGYWAEPSSFDRGEVSKTYPLATRRQAARAILNAAMINAPEGAVSVKRLKIEAN